MEEFLKSINFLDIEALKDVEIKKVVLNKKDEVFNVYLTSKQVLPYEVSDA